MKTQTLPDLFVVCKNKNIVSYEVHKYTGQDGPDDIFLDVTFQDGEWDSYSLLPFDGTEELPKYDLSSFSPEDVSEVQTGYVTPTEGLIAILCWPN